jgi:hypothetical protein
MTTAAELHIRIWTGDERQLPDDKGDIAEKMPEHLRHIARMCEQGCICGDVVDEEFRGWWEIIK